MAAIDAPDPRGPTLSEGPTDTLSAMDPLCQIKSILAAIHAPESADDTPTPKGGSTLDRPATQAPSSRILSATPLASRFSPGGGAATADATLDDGVVESPAPVAVLEIPGAVKAPPRAPRVDPSWLRSIVDITFFGDCEPHLHDIQKPHHNFHCLGCGPSGGAGAALCPACLPAHAARCDGRVIQIYRYMHHDIVRVEAVQDLVDLGGIQQYRANGHPAVHIHPMGPPANKSPYVSACGGACGRFLDDHWAWCSLSCKFGLGPGAGAIGRRRIEAAAAAAAPAHRKGVSPAGRAMKNTNTPSSSAAGGSGASAALAAATAPQSSEGCRYMPSDDDGDLEGAGMRTRMAGKRGLGALRASLVGAKRRKPFRPHRSPSI